MSYSSMLYEMKAVYGEATNNKGLSMYQAFAYAYDEMDLFLHSEDDRVSVEAFAALFICGVKGGVAFVMDDPFTQDVFKELGVAYSRLSALELGDGINEDDKLMLEHIQLIAGCIGVIDF